MRDVSKLIAFFICIAVLQYCFFIISINYIHLNYFLPLDSLREFLSPTVMKYLYLPLEHLLQNLLNLILVVAVGLYLSKKSVSFKMVVTFFIALMLSNPVSLLFYFFVFSVNLNISIIVFLETVVISVFTMPLLGILSYKLNLRNT